MREFPPTQFHHFKIHAHSANSREVHKAQKGEPTLRLIWNIKLLRQDLHGWWKIAGSQYTHHIIPCNPYLVTLKSQIFRLFQNASWQFEVWSIHHVESWKMMMQLQLHNASPVSDLQAWWSPAWSKEAMRMCYDCFEFLDRNSVLYFWDFGKFWELGNYLQNGISFLSDEVKATRLSATTEFPQPKVSTELSLHRSQGQGKTTTKRLAGTYQGQWNVVAPAQKKKATTFAERIAWPVQRSSLQQVRGHETKQPSHARHCSMTMPSSPCNTCGTLTQVVSCSVQSEASNPKNWTIWRFSHGLWDFSKLAQCIHLDARLRRDTLVEEVYIKKLYGPAELITSTINYPWPRNLLRAFRYLWTCVLLCKRLKV